MKSTNNYERAKNKALSLLSFKAYTEKQIKDKLSEKEFDDNIILDVVEELKQCGMIDDLFYGKALADELFNLKFLSSRAVALKLREKGIGRNTIDDILYEFRDIDELKNAVNLLDTKFKEINDEKTAQRSAGLLSRAGYSYDIIKTAIHTKRNYEQED